MNGGEYLEHQPRPAETDPTEKVRAQGQEAKEAPFDVAPRIYVASLSDYNDGRLHGAWIDAAQDVEAIHDAVQAMMSASPTPGAEEYAIHDYQGFGPIELSEYEPIDSVAEIADKVTTHGRPYAFWHAYVGETARTEFFDEAYVGTYGSLQDFAEQLQEDVGAKITVEPASWEHYVHFNTEALARDLAIEYYVAEDRGIVHVFAPWV